MNRFTGFNSETNDFLVGITFNNNKEWFYEHKKMYDENVHKAITLLANEVYEKMHAYDDNFLEIPKISRINRDLRFSKDKRPYKLSKWFFLRGDGKPDIIYPRPSFYFEISANTWSYGLLFWAKPAGMAKYRQMIEANRAEFENIIKKLKKNKQFLISGEKYKRIYNTDLSEELQDFAQRKELVISSEREYTDTVVYSPELPNFIFEEYKKLYPLYKFLLRGSLNE
ncbi:MAG TPA: hypothetical protein DCG28_02895 [Lachnospiraceae bacterium]|nr:hypothetical protein [Lachnospiraceae bacterium]